MYIGKLTQWPQQRAVLPDAVNRALDALAQLDLAGMPAGRYEIDGDRLYFMIQEMITQPFEAGRPEAHRRYADIQLLLSGEEGYGIAPPDPALPVLDDFFEGRDIGFYATPVNEQRINLLPGDFVVFYPGELHRPGRCVAESMPIRKVVVKIDRTLLGL
ncbi:YhcH/YjgK/YiaL family protein [Jeongeupia naejangsanensis]|uniref:YhcH/YjgK/YiaL family protein n=1 Tax=Jeongeupia naejangsanensis TaxID=613195 RepID=A0ABS2BI96_9NEIS|nr:YhcH/YjgK/YiaL family protein [Jeongeupia naejangsanensis]MBM3115332.1 YhcH/YjgK/YiaL family protein [Jeongeupia naejangsanensis]